MDEKELQAVGEALEQLRAGSTVSAETLAKLGGTAQSANKALEGYTKKILGAASAVGGMARQVADGEGSFKSLGGAIGGLTSIVGKLAGALPLVGGAARALAEGVGEAAKFVLDQLDTMSKNYQTLGDASATAADGVSGLLRQFNQMGNYSLPAFTKAVKDNTEGLAALGGNAAMGAEQLSKVAGVLTTKDTARQFIKLGIGLDAVGNTTAQYLSDFSKSGVLQGLTTTQLTKKTQDYILEVDKIARLTGQTRQQQQEEMKKSMANAQFRAQISQMTASGQKDQAESLKMFANAIGGPAADAIRAYATGVPLTTQAAEANIFTNDKLREITMKVRDGQLSAAEATVQLQDAMSGGVKQFGQITAVGKDLGGMFVQSANQQAIANAENKTYSERLADATATVDKLKNADDKVTKELVDAQLATAGASKNLEGLGFSLAEAAVPAVKKFATALEDVTGYINKNFGVGGTKSTPAGADRGASGGPRAGGGGGGGGGGGAGGGGPSTLRRFGQAIGAVGPGPDVLAGLRIKSAESTAGGETSQQLANMARTIQEKLGGDLHQFSAFNDLYERKGNSLHRQGRALDFTLTDPSKSATIATMLGSIPGISYVKDEYLTGSASKTGGHIHAEISAAQGGVFSGPASGYPATLHGNEAVIPLKNGAVPVSLPEGVGTVQFQKFAELIGKHSLLRNESSGSMNLVDTGINQSESFKTEMEGLKERAMSMPQADAMLAALNQMNEQMRAEAAASHHLLVELLKGNDTSNQIASKILKHAQ